MAREPYPRGLIQKVFEEYNRPTEALRAFRAAGGKIQDSRWFKVWGDIQNEHDLHGIEEGRALHLRPTADEILPMHTVRARGFMQRVTVYGLTANGDPITKIIDIKSGTLLSRQHAIARAMQVVESINSPTGLETGSIPKTVIAGTYSGTYEQIPMG